MRGIIGRGGVRNRKAENIATGVIQLSKARKAQDLSGGGNSLGDVSHKPRETSEQRVVTRTSGALISRDKKESETGRGEQEDKDATQIGSNISVNAGQGLGAVGSEGVEKELLVNESHMVTQQKADNSMRVERLGHEEDSGQKRELGGQRVLQEVDQNNWTSHTNQFAQKQKRWILEKKE